MFLIPLHVFTYALISSLCIVLFMLCVDMVARSWQLCGEQLFNIPVT